MKKNRITNISFEEAKKLKSQTDSARVDAMRDEDIDLSDIPEVTPEMWARAVVKRGGVTTKPTKPQITIRIDADVLEWFRARGRGYQTEMSALLRAYMEEHAKRAG
jgi:uncharacterized protein (DUF4415 family)